MTMGLVMVMEEVTMAEAKDTTDTAGSTALENSIVTTNTEDPRAMVRENLLMVKDKGAMGKDNRTMTKA